ncbi:MAG TPA: hypothetical protein VGP68_19155 [Gemmataceae bacterium]|jgi:hypothetical protein|nr:hypothetical protein [Gemmataceae bacterium]
MIPAAGERRKALVMLNAEEINKNGHDQSQDAKNPYGDREVGQNLLALPIGMGPETVLAPAATIGLHGHQTQGELVVTAT